MRVTICSAVLLLLFGTGWTPAASAQDVQAGVKVGVNFSDLRFEENDEIEDLDTRTGIAAGGFVVWPLTPAFALQTEALYSQKGASLSEDGVTGALELDYLEIPVLARFSTTPGSNSKLHLYAGPSFNFNIRARTKMSFAGETAEEDFSDEVKSFETALVLGASFEVNRLLFDGRYSWGLTNIDKEDGSLDPAVKTRAFTLSAGIRF